MAQTEKGHERTASTDHRTSWSWRKLFGKDDHRALLPSPPVEEAPEPPGPGPRLSRKVVPELPRAGTFKRQQSELRDRLEPVKPNHDERRTVSVDRRRHASCRNSSVAVANARLSAPELLETTETIDAVLNHSELPPRPTSEGNGTQIQEYVDLSKQTSNVETASYSTGTFDDMILEELERLWILNLSMHFRDKSRREKFFVTYAETPTHWRRVTISLDYRNAPPGSLEEELVRTRFQRDKSARIYEAIRESLPDIQFYDTVTNLKLQTENDRLHVHVVEDIAEIISYPPVKAISHLACRRVPEDELMFDSHLSGFVYKVTVNDEVFIKKEIPGPDTVDEFLYEINALHQLSGSRSVINFGGVVLDRKGEIVKGLLISFAEQGALIDVIYDGDGKIPWGRRERWARQIVQGLAEIHEAGFVQGDFTLSNIVIDGDDNAKIIDINRRGCPVGWEPPEVAALIDSNQRISMYIGVKSDLFQLGMVLYALAMQHDEPETQRPLDLGKFPAEIPGYYLDICRRCLNNDPRGRSQAEVLLRLFPDMEETVYHLDHPIPIIVDARHTDDVFSNDDRFSPENLSTLRKPSYQYSPGFMPPGRHGYADSEVTDEWDYFRGRGRSPPAARRYEITPCDIPLPRSCTESDYTDSTRDSTPTQNRLAEIAPSLAVTSEPGDGPQHIDAETPHIAAAAEAPGTTAPATRTPTALPSELTGVGGAYSGDVEIPTVNLDDDLTTDTTDTHVFDTVAEGCVGLA
jgi:serine/threonine protein kinase